MIKRGPITYYRNLSKEVLLYEDYFTILRGVASQKMLRYKVVRGKCQHYQVGRMLGRIWKKWVVTVTRPTLFFPPTLNFQPCDGNKQRAVWWMHWETWDGAVQWSRVAHAFLIAFRSKVRMVSFTTFLDTHVHFPEGKKACLPTFFFFFFLGGWKGAGGYVTPTTTCFFNLDFACMLGHMLGSNGEA